jgi:hypothetical protein
LVLRQERLDLVQLDPALRERRAGDHGVADGDLLGTHVSLGEVPGRRPQVVDPHVVSHCRSRCAGTTLDSDCFVVVNVV